MRARTQKFCHATLAVASGAIFWTIAVEEALARCYVPHFNFTFGQHLDAQMTASSGEPCNIKMREGRGTIIKSLVTVSRPKGGTVAAQNSVNLTYRSRPGFQGAETGSCLRSA